MRNARKKKIVLIGGIVGLFGLLSMSLNFAASGLQQILLLDREPFYSPSTLNLETGQTVYWYNRSMQSHTITHDSCGQGGGCAFHSGHIHPGEQYSVRDLRPGTYSYHCNIHPFMRGVIVVKPSSNRTYHPLEL